MELALLVYIISFISSLTALLIVSAIASLATLVVSWIVVIENQDHDYQSTSRHERNAKTRDSAKKYKKAAFIVLIVTGFVSTVIPNEKTAYMMVAAYAAQKTVENPDVIRVSGKVLKIIEDKMDTYIDEAEKAVKSKIQSK